jgi:hypothetical protein
MLLRCFFCYMSSHIILGFWVSFRGTLTRTTLKINREKKPTMTCCGTSVTIQLGRWHEYDKLTLATFYVLLGPFLTAQEPILDKSLSCVASLELPTHGLLAARAGTSGTVAAIIRVAEGGAVSALELAGGNDILQAEVRVAVKLSTFDRKCQGRSVQIIYAFTLEDPATDSIIPPAVRFIPPNRFELTFRKVKPNIEPPPPPPSKSKK